jgi:hypothetical protein
MVEGLILLMAVMMVLSFGFLFFIGVLLALKAFFVFCDYIDRLIDFLLECEDD